MLKIIHSSLIREGKVENVSSPRTTSDNAFKFAVVLLTSLGGEIDQARDDLLVGQLAREVLERMFGHAPIGALHESFECCCSVDVIGVVGVFSDDHSNSF